MKKSTGILLITMILLMLSGCNTAIQTDSEYVDVEQTPSTLMFVSQGEDTSVGDLYYQPLYGEKEKISEGVLKDEYMLMPDTQGILYLTSEHVLYYKANGQEKEQVADRVLSASYSYSDDESTVAFIRTVDDNEESLSELYIRKFGNEKEKITADLPHYTGSDRYMMSNDASKIFFLNNDNVLYSVAGSNDKEKIAADVSDFSVTADGEAYTYRNNQNSYYVKWADDRESQKITSEAVGKMIINDDGRLAAFTGSFNAEKGVGELYIAIKNSDLIKIASDVKQFDLVKNGQYLYYINDEDVLYVKELPQVTEETSHNQSKFSSDVGVTEKTKLRADVLSYSINPDNNSVLIIDNDNNLYLSDGQDEKIKVASDVTQVRVFANSFIFLNKNGQLYLNSDISDTEKISDNNKTIAQYITGFETSTYGKYVIFSTSEDDAIMVCIDGQNPDVIITDSSAYDEIMYNDKIVYEKKLKLGDIVGNYKSVDLDMAFKITADSKFVYYTTGQEQENTAFYAYGIDKFMLSMESDDQNSVLTQDAYIITKKSDGSMILTYNGTEYDLTPMNDDELNAEIERQKKEEEARQAEELRRQAEEEARQAEEKRKIELEAKKSVMAERGRTYMKNGIYVPTTQTLYYSPSFESASNITYTNPGNRSVYDYYVSSDGNTLWLKLYTTASRYGGYTGYVWICLNYE